RLFSALPGTTAGPRAPPFKIVSSPRRSSPERWTREPWHITQFRSKIGATFSLKKSEAEAKAAAPRCCDTNATPIAQSDRSLQALSVKLRLFIYSPSAFPNALMRRDSLLNGFYRF